MGVAAAFGAVGVGIGGLETYGQTIGFARGPDRLTPRGIERSRVRLRRCQSGVAMIRTFVMPWICAKSGWERSNRIW